MTIAQEVLAGLQEAGADTGDGQPVTATIIKAGSATGTGLARTQGAGVDHSCTVLYSKWSKSEIDGTVIRVDDIKVLVAATGVEPEVGDRFWDGAMNGSERVTKEIVPPLMKLAPAGAPLLYTINVRG